MKKKASVIGNLVRRMSISPSLGAISLGGSIGKTKTLDPTIIDNDLEVPPLTDVRQRPAPRFESLTDRKPKVLSKVKKEPEAKSLFKASKDASRSPT